MSIVSKIFKFLSPVFMISFFIYNCSAVKDFRYITNSKISDEIERYHNISLIQDEYFSTKDSMCCQIQFNKMVFAVNYKDVTKAIIGIPVFSSVRKYVGEVITPVTFENVNKIDDVLNTIVSNSETCPNFKLGKSYFKHFLKTRDTLAINTNVDSIIVFLNKAFLPKENDRIFYETSECSLKNSFDKVNLVLETTEFNETVQNKLKFQNSKGVNLIESPLSINPEITFRKDLYRCCFVNKYSRLKSD